MFTRHLIAAAAMTVATFSAHADVISTAPDALASNSVIANAAASGASTLDADMSIVDSGTAMNGAQLYLVRGVEGLYMLASRLGGVANTTPAAGAATPALAADGATPAALVPVAAADEIIPTVDAADVPEPSSIALLLAGLLGAAAFTRARKQG